MPLPTENVETINKAVLEIVEKAESGMLNITCRFISSSNPDLDIVVPLLDRIDIQQNFIQEYTDRIEVEVSLQPDHYQEIYDSYQGLQCLLEFRKVEKDTFKVSEPILKIQRLAAFKDRHDIYKRHQTGNLVKNSKDGKKKDPSSENQTYSNRIRTTFELLEFNLHNLRRCKFNYIGRDMTVEQAIYTVAHQLNIKKVSVIAPDNNRIYTNFIVPPMMSIDNFFHYLQHGDGLGVYNKNLCYYYHEKVLYVYPMFETERSTKRVFNFYNVGKDTYMGTDGTYWLKGETTTHILINSEVKDKDLLPEGIDNEGDMYSLLPMEDIIDTWRIKKEGGSTIPKNTIEVGLDTSDGIIENNHNQIYRRSRDNEYTFTSQLSEIDGTIVAFGWNYSIPFLIKPGDQINFIYDNKDKITPKPGLVNEMTYTILPQNVQDKRYFYCNAQINARIKS